MKYLWTITLLLLVLFNSCKKEEELDDIIYGTVRDAYTEEPIPNATVIFENAVLDGLNINYEFVSMVVADDNGRFTVCRENNYDFARAQVAGYLDETASAVGIDNNYFCQFSIYLKPLATLRLIVRDNPDLNDYSSVTYFLPGQGLSEEFTHSAGMDEQEWNLTLTGGQTHNLYLTWDQGTPNEELEPREIFIEPHELNIYLLEY